MTTKLILTHEVTGLGAPGEIVDVKDGYARNFLLPRRLATPWTAGGEKQIAQIRSARKAHQIATIEDAQKLKETLESRPVAVQVRSGQNGRLFGAVTGSDVAASVQDTFKVTIDKRKVEFATPVKSLGDHRATVRLHDDVFANLTVQVVAAKGA